MSLAKVWLADAASVAEQVYSDDHSNETKILEFWNFNETAAALIQVLRDTIADSEDSKINVEEFYRHLGEDPSLQLTVENFTKTQIETIAKSAYPSYLFALHVLKNRFPAGEESIERHPFLWGEYQWIINQFSSH
jgi:hypothetical protein